MTVLLAPRRTAGVADVHVAAGRPRDGALWHWCWEHQPSRTRRWSAAGAAALSAARRTRAAQLPRGVRRPAQRARAFPLRQPWCPVAGGQKKMQRRWPVRAPHCLMVHFGHDFALWAPCKAPQARWAFFCQAKGCCQTRHKVSRAEANGLGS